MTTEQKLKIQALYIIVVQAVKVPIKNPKRSIRNLLEHAVRLFPGFDPPQKQWELLWDKLGALVSKGDAEGAKQLLAQALLPVGTPPEADPSAREDAQFPQPDIQAKATDERDTPAHTGPNT